MRLFVTGDTHGDVLWRCQDLKNKLTNLNKDDYLIICGDFGLIWGKNPPEFEWDEDRLKQEEWQIKEIGKMPFNVLFVDGNHECMNKETDVLTELGWMNIVEAYNYSVPLKIATYDRKRQIIRYLYPNKKIRTYSDTIIDFIGNNYKQSVTKSHDVLINGKKVKAIELINKKVSESDLKHNVNNDTFVGYSCDMIELLTAIVMDATIVDYNKKNPNSDKIRIQFHFIKQRKIDYICELLKATNIPYKERYGYNNDVYICIYGSHARRLFSLLGFKKELPQIFSKMNSEEFEHFLFALQNTDGWKINDRIVWRTISKHNVDIIQEACLRNNYQLCCSVVKNPSGFNLLNCQTQYNIGIGKKKRFEYLKIAERSYNDYAYCFTMPGTGTLITKYQNSVCITGNCHTRLNNEFPVIDFHGGKAHQISDNIFHLMRGEMYDFNGKKIFTFGGARSHDIWNLLDPKAADYWDKVDELRNDFYRTIDESWWEDEIATEEEFRHGYETLKKHDWKCDYIFTHEAPMSDAMFLKRNGGVMCDFLESVKRATDYKGWFYGHHHINKLTSPGTRCLYYDIMMVDDMIDSKETEPFSKRQLEQIIEKAKTEREEVLTGEYQ